MHQKGKPSPPKPPPFSVKIVEAKHTRDVITSYIVSFLNNKTCPYSTMGAISDNSSCTTWILKAWFGLQNRFELNMPTSCHCRCCLLLLLITCRGGSFGIEQPGSSLMEHFHRMRWVYRKIRVSLFIMGKGCIL